MGDNINRKRRCIVKKIINGQGSFEIKKDKLTGYVSVGLLNGPTVFATRAI